jgi:protein SCO1/2
MSKKTLIFMTIFSLGLVAFSLYIIKTLDPGVKPKPTSEVMNVTSLDMKLDGTFKLKNTDGSDFTVANLENKFTLLYFGFAHCPDICPETLLKIKKTIELMGEKEKKDAQFIFVSIDPNRDNMVDLENFVKQFGNSIKAITGEKAELDKLTNSLKVYYGAQESKTGDDYYVDHSSFMYLLNPQAELISQFTPNAAAEDVAKQIMLKMNQ